MSNSTQCRWLPWDCKRTVERQDWGERQSLRHSVQPASSSCHSNSLTRGVPEEALKLTAVTKIRLLRCRTRVRLATKVTNAQEKVAQSDKQMAMTSENAVEDTALETEANNGKTVPAAEEIRRIPLPHHQTTIGTVKNQSRIIENSTDQKNKIAEERKKSQRRKMMMIRRVRVKVRVESRTRYRTQNRAVLVENRTTRMCGVCKRTGNGRISSLSGDQSTKTQMKEMVQRRATLYSSSAVPKRPSLTR